MDTRSSDILSRFVFDGVELTFQKQEKLDLTRAQQLPTHKYVIERHLTMVKEKSRTLPDKLNILMSELTTELRDIWIFMNIPPKSYTASRRQVKSLIDQYSKLSKTAISKRKDTWKMQMNELRDKLSKGFDIKCEDKESINKCIEEYGVVPGEEENTLYTDNCCNGSRLRWCSGVDTVWWKDVDVLDDDQVTAEASYLKKTMAPNIRFKRKVDNKFIKFTTEELRRQIKDAIKPTFDQAEDLGTLINKVLCDEDMLTGTSGAETAADVASSSGVQTVAVGTVGWWSNTLEEEKVGVLVEESSLQLYKLCRYGFKPSGLPVDLEEFTLKEKIVNYEYVMKGDAIFLVI